MLFQTITQNFRFSNIGKRLICLRIATNQYINSSFAKLFTSQKFINLGPRCGQRLACPI